MSDKPIVYEDEDTGQIIYRASALGGGVGALVAARMGYDAIEPPAWLLKRFKQSGALEDDIIEMWLSECSPLGSFALPENIEREPEVSIRISDKIYIVGHCDGVSEKFGIEIKALGPDYMKKYKTHGIWLNKTYPMQLSVYMHATGLPFYFIVYDKDNDELSWELFTTPPLSREEIEKVIEGVEQYVQDGDMPTKCGCTSGYCPYSYLHEDEEEIELFSDENLDALVEEYNRCRAAEKRKKEIQKMIGETLKKKDKKSIETTAYKVTMVDGNGKTLDEAKLKEALEALGIDIDDFKREYVYQYPRVTVRDNGEGG